MRSIPGPASRRRSRKPVSRPLWGCSTPSEMRMPSHSAGNFIGHCLAGQPIDAAVTEGRLAIFNQTDESERDWGVPVLYLRAEAGEGVLFHEADEVDAAQSLPAQAGPRVVSTDPPNGATGISRNLAMIKITFDRDMQADRHGLQAEPGDAFDLADVKIDYDRPTRTFTFIRGKTARPLPPNTRISFGVNVPPASTGFMDLAGNRVEPYHFTFMTGAQESERLRPPDGNVDRVALRGFLVRTFSLEDLSLLCQDIEQDLDDRGIHLQVSMEMVGGSSLEAKVLNLIQYLDRRGYLGYLVNAARAARPGAF